MKEPIGIEDAKKLHKKLCNDLEEDQTKIRDKEQFYRAEIRRLWEEHYDRMESIRRECAVVGRLIADYYALQPVPVIIVKEEGENDGKGAL